MNGEYQNDWKPTKAENPNFKCWKCGSNEIQYRRWESSCGGFDDIHYRCDNCQNDWWIDGADA